MCLDGPAAREKLVKLVISNLFPPNTQPILLILEKEAFGGAV
jgi:hypothetical protein